jgi:hypothetical protein
MVSMKINKIKILGLNVHYFYSNLKKHYDEMENEKKKNKRTMWTDAFCFDKCDEMITKGASIEHLMEIDNLREFVFNNIDKLEKYIEYEKKRKALEPYDPDTFVQVGPWVG